MSMDIYTKPGSKVKFTHPENGKPRDQKRAKEELKIGKIYTLKEIFAGDSRTEVKLKEVPSIWFNSVHFENLKK